MSNLHKVWILLNGAEYEGESILSVHSSKSGDIKEAERWMDDHNKNTSDDKYKYKKTGDCHWKYRGCY